MTIVKGTKLDNKKSRFTQEKEAISNFENTVEQTIQQNEDFQKLAFNLGSSFIKIMEDSTLPENKSQTTISLEKENLAKLIEFAKVVNNSESEPLGMGSVSLIVLLFKSSLMLRDKLNQLEFKNYQLEKKLEQIQAKNESGS